MHFQQVTYGFTPSGQSTSRVASRGFFGSPPPVSRSFVAEDVDDSADAGIDDDFSTGDGECPVCGSDTDPARDDDGESLCDTNTTARDGDDDE